MVIRRSTTAHDLFNLSSPDSAKYRTSFYKDMEMELCLFLNNLLRLLCCYKSAHISVKTFQFIYLLRTWRIKQQIRPVIKIIYKLQTAT